MVSPRSELYAAHPDWCLHVPGRPRSEGRNQLVLDLGRAEVRRHIVDSGSAILASASRAISRKMASSRAGSACESLTTYERWTS